MSQNAKNWVRLLFLALVWGSSFILIKRGLFYDGEEVFNFYQIGASRMVFAGLVLLPFSLKGIKTLNKVSNIFYLSIVGFCGNFIPAFMFAFAEGSISSGLAGMLNSSTPIFTIILGLFLFKQKLIKIQVLGIALGTIGVILLVVSSSGIYISGSIYAILAAIFATLCYAISLNVIKFKLAHLSPLIITSLGFLMTLPLGLFIFFFQETPTVLVENEFGYYGMAHILILGVVGTALAVIVFTRLIADSSPVFASSVTYFIPIVAVFIGFFDGENLSVLQVLSLFIVLAGVYIINYSSRRRNRLEKIAKQ